MQQDVYGAIDWLADQDLVDTDRSCIVGKGYGGFVALTAAYQRQDQFRCIVSIGGPVDLVEFLDTKLLRGRADQDEWRRSLTDSPQQASATKLKEYSPKTHIGKLRSPLLLIHGARDSEVPLRQVRGFARSVSFARNARIEYLEIESADQDFGDNASRLAIFQKLDEFLKKHLN
jgi:dipeptidyl aminopeptidase/acylaminoacyl peptidase